jgi:hypothetical protein
VPVGLVEAGAHINDFKLLEPTLQSIPIERPKPTEQRPQGMSLDKGYDYSEVDEIITRYELTPHIQRRRKRAAAEEGVAHEKQASEEKRAAKERRAQRRAAEKQRAAEQKRVAKERRAQRRAAEKQRAAEQRRVAKERRAQRRAAEKQRVAEEEQGSKRQGEADKKTSEEKQSPEKDKATEAQATGGETTTGAKKKARRWVVERTHSWMNRFRRLLVRWEKRADTYEAMLHLACGLICFRLLGLLG